MAAEEVDFLELGKNLPDDEKSLAKRVRSEYRFRYQKIYKKHAPQRLDAIEGLLDKYAGKEHNLYGRMCFKYGTFPETEYTGYGVSDFMLFQAHKIQQQRLIDTENEDENGNITVIIETIEEEETELEEDEKEMMEEDQEEEMMGGELMGNDENSVNMSDIPAAMKESPNNFQIISDLEKSASTKSLLRIDTDKMLVIAEKKMIEDDDAFLKMDISDLERLSNHAEIDLHEMSPKQELIPKQIQAEVLSSIIPIESQKNQITKEIKSCLSNVSKKDIQTHSRKVSDTSESELKHKSIKSEEILTPLRTNRVSFQLVEEEKMFQEEIKNEVKKESNLITIYENYNNTSSPTQPMEEKKKQGECSY